VVVAWSELCFLGVLVLVKTSTECGCLAGPAGAYYMSHVLSLSGARGHLDAGLKCLVQTGLDLKSPFNSNGLRSRRKPDWPVYWQPWTGPLFGNCREELTVLRAEKLI
jgi:hypothetical protein